MRHTRQFPHTMPLSRAVLLLLAALVPALNSQAAPLSLADALERADQAGFAVRLARESANQASARADQSRVSLLPSIQASAAQRRAQSVSISNDTTVPGGTGNRFDGRLSGSVPVLDPARLAAWRAARTGVNVAGFELDSLREQALSAVAQAFFTHQRNHHRMSVIDANIARAQALLTLARNQAAAGAATKIDVTRAEAQLAQAEQARLQQQTLLITSELALKRLLDLPAASPLALQPAGIRRIETPDTTPAPDEASRLRRADYAAASRALEQFRQELRAARWQRLPALSVSGDYGYVAPDLASGDRRQAWSASGVLSIPVFDGTRSAADTRLALSRLRAQEIRVAQLALQIDSEQRLALQDTRSRLAQVLVAEKSLRLAEEEMSLARLRYEQDVADNREVVEAQTRMATAADSLVEAEYQYQLSRIELCRSRGDLRALLTETL